MFFPLPHTAQLYKRKTTDVTFNRSGQITPGGEVESVAITIPHCLFFGFSGNKSLHGREDFSQTIEFYAPPGTNIDEGDIIKNVVGMETFEPGPFEVLSVRKVSSPMGRVHHLSMKLKGITG